MIVLLTWRNLWRNRRRTLLTMASVSFAVLLAILMKSFQRGAFDNLIDNVVNYYTGFIQVHADGYWNEQVLDNGFVYNDTLKQKLLENPHVKTFVPRIESFALASAGNLTKGCMVVGTIGVKEDQLTGLKRKIVKGRYFNENEPEAILAEGLARRLKITTGDTIVLLGQGYHGAIAAGKYPVIAIVHFGSPELSNGLVFLPLPIAQSFLRADDYLTSIALKIDDADNIPAVQKDLESRLNKHYEVMNWKELMPYMDNYIKADNVGFYFFTGVLYLIIAFGIFGTILMMTAERRYEFGMLIAIGMKKSRLGWMLFYETVLITLLGMICGIILCLPLVFYFQEHPIILSGQMQEVYEQFGFEAIFPAKFNAGIVLDQSLIVLAISFIIGLYPLWYVKGVQPAKAMKK